MFTTPNKQCVLALGFFDGVHRGHGALLERTVLRARQKGVAPAVMTFDTHPDTLVHGEAVPLINSAPDRALLIREGYGIDQVEFFRFTEDTMRLPWSVFLDDIRAELGAVHFVVGYDFRFGWRGEGNADKLSEYCDLNGLSCDIIGQVQLGGITVSSTYIRRLLLSGDMRTARAFMGHPHLLTDVVRQGQRLGRRLGAPTINMQFASGVLVPRYGVYATRVRLPDGVFPSVTNIGIRPTVAGGSSLSVETHILDYSGNLYGRTVSLEFFDFLREEQRFSDLAELSAQIVADGELSRRILEECS